MKKFQWKQAAVLCTIATLLAGTVMTGCDQNDPEGQQGNSAGGQHEELQSITYAKNLKLPAEEYPAVDGSTATVPLSESFASAVMNLPLSEARQYIAHNKTHQAYVNLIDGSADIIFVTSPSQDELDYAAEKDVELEVTPIVSEGFVFLVSKENPVESLTLEQIQDIYKGKITNWKEVGGTDQEIIAYQRPDNSGSQTGMYDLVVSAEDIMEAPTELKPYGMGDLVDAVSDFENGPGAIGYSYYYYVTDMWINEGVKLLAVDGITPSAETIADGSYPIRTAYYAVTRKNMSTDSNAAKLLSWILSEEGQKTAEDAGYVRVGSHN